MKWWDIIKFCGNPEREPFHPNDPPIEPNKPYAEKEKSDNVDKASLIPKPRLPIKPMQKELLEILGDEEHPENEKLWKTYEDKISRSAWFNKWAQDMKEKFKRKILMRPRDR